METNQLNENFGTLSETINGLVSLGYTHDFNIKNDCITCHKTNINLSPDEFQIDKVYRFEGDSDPEYQSILYAISSTKFNVKGTLVNGYGISSDENTSELIKKLNTHHELINIENKTNDNGKLRPEKENISNSPLVEINLNEVMEQLKKEATWTDSDRNSITLFKSETMNIVVIGLHENSEIKPHKAHGVISVQVLEGNIEFTAEAQKSNLKKGQMITLLEDTTHSVKALSESFFLLTLAKANK